MTPAIPTQQQLAVTQEMLKTFKSMEQKLVSKISTVIDEKLEGMDEVVVELIRCKSENETLRQRINELNKDIYALKRELNLYRPVAFNLYVRQQEEF